MRRHDREVTDWSDILRILDACDTLHVALQAEAYPYVVPLSFGWEERDGRVALYVHGAREGMRHALMARCPRVAVEASRMLRYVDTGRGLTCAYESVMGTGEAEALEGPEAERGLRAIARHCGFAEADLCPKALLAATSVWRITLGEITGKRRTV